MFFSHISLCKIQNVTHESQQREKLSLVHPGAVQTSVQSLQLLQRPHGDQVTGAIHLVREFSSGRVHAWAPCS